MAPLRLVLSGGQIGADIAGVRAAKACGLDTGGFMPFGYRTLLGPLDPELVREYGFVANSSSNYPSRTRQNILASDGTIQLAYNFESAGERLTTRLIKELRRPDYRIHLQPEGGSYVINRLAWPSVVEDVANWIVDNEIEILNVAGNADLRIEAEVERFLVAVFSKLK